MIGPKRSAPTKAEERDAYELVVVRDLGVCVYCGGVDPAFGVNRDHRKNRSQGGQTRVENLQLLCGSGTTGCHGRKSVNPAWAIREGLAVPGWADPLEWPARRRVDGVLTWVLYVADIDWFEYPTGFRVIHAHDAFELMGQVA